MHRHANIRHVCETYGAQVLGITPDDVTFSVAKMFFAYGIGNTVFFPFSVGATTVLEPRRPTPGRRTRAARAGPADAVLRGADVLRRADRRATCRPTRSRRVRLCASAGEPLPGAAAASVHRPVRRGDPRRHRLHRGAAHLPVQPSRRHPSRHHRHAGARATTSSCATRTAAPCRAGEPGALHVRGESIALGYWHRTDATRQVFQGEWLVTGDTYVRNDEGYYTCLGRNSDMLKAGGIWVSPGRGGEPAAGAPRGPRGRRGRRRRRATASTSRSPWWSSRDGVAEDDLVAWCRDGLAHFKAPRQVVFVDRAARRPPPASCSASRSATSSRRPGRTRAQPTELEVAPWGVTP